MADSTSSEISSDSADRNFLTVGLGASAGGLEALEAFFESMPADSGMAFVVITHLASGQVSMLPELLGRACRMPVVSITGELEALPNHVYVPPPGARVGILHGVLHLIEQSESTPRRAPIDFFFRSLAQDQKGRSVGIVLSGTGSDGTLGLEEIKGAAGMTMAQEEATASFPGMPHSAIAGSSVDYILAPGEMARQLVAYSKGIDRRLHASELELENEAVDTLNRIFLLLRSQTGQDFSHYKRSTIRRRIERRMDVHQIETAKDYLRFLQTNPDEINRLFKEFLIGVTSFFRDPEAFEALASEVIPRILADKPDDYLIRVWVPGCSTGEEAYSIAMLFREGMDQTNRQLGLQIFATDIDARAVEAARTGIFPESIAADVGQKRLERFFIREDGFYRIRKDIREALVFAEQSVIEDPPFTKQDLLSCRNLLIYLDGSLQQRLIPMFHYALRPGGYLFLGSSETVGSYGELFEVVDKKWKFFRRRDVTTSGFITDLSSLPFDSSRAVPSPGIVPRKQPDPPGTQTVERALLQNLLPPSIIMHERGEIVHIHGRTGMFLEPAQGHQSQANVYNMAREGLQLELAAAIRDAGTSNSEVLHRGVRVKANGSYVRVDLRAKKLTQPEALRGLFIVSFERPTDEGAAKEGANPVDSQSADRIAHLERELQHSKEVHQGTTEELETTNEELKSANEELQSTNEELQSANEELETSKEEMQSLNEELQTVNSELQGKVEELSRANDDMNNLLNATDIATLFLDNELNIKRYTERAKRLIRLIPSDVGRHIGDLASRLRYTGLVEDATEVLRTLVFKETEVRSDEGSWYLMRIRPYRTTENMIDGLVLTFVDVTNLKALQEQTRRVLAALRNSPTSVFGQNADLRYEWSCSPLLGRMPEEILGRTDADVLPPESLRELMALKHRVLESGSAERKVLEFGLREVSSQYDVYLEPVRDPSGAVTGLTGVMTKLKD